MLLTHREFIMSSPNIIGRRRFLRNAALAVGVLGCHCLGLTDVHAQTRRRLSGPDPVALRIDFDILSRTGRYTGRVRITGVVRNLGDAPSGRGAALLSQGGTIVARQFFPRLAGGEQVTVSYDRNWDASSPREGRSPPTYRLWIVYEPDTPTGGDVNLSNNDKTRNGTGINALLRRRPDTVYSDYRRELRRR
jgi:hypothetical protein